jgi:transcriptional regulator with XRE-family HTH domain
MDGEILRKKIKDTGVPIAEIARKLGQSRPNLSQALSTKDVKTGLVEKLAAALNLPLSYFYGDSGTNVIASGEKSLAALNSTITKSNPQGVEILEERIRSLESQLYEKERLIKVYEKFCNMNEVKP